MNFSINPAYFTGRFTAQYLIPKVPAAVAQALRGKQTFFFFKPVITCLNAATGCRNVHIYVNQSMLYLLQAKFVKKCLQYHRVTTRKKSAIYEAPEGSQHARAQQSMKLQ